MSFGRHCSLGAAVVLASGLTLAAAQPAAAKSKPIVVKAIPENVQTERVNFEDLNLVNKAGQRTLHRRVAGAVKLVCGGPDTERASFFEGRRCQTVAWNGARPQIDRAVQRAHEIARNGSSTIPAVAIRISARR